MAKVRLWIEGHLVEFLVLTIFLDFLTLGATAIIASRQGDTLDELQARSCHNSGVLIGLQRAQRQQSSPKLYRTFFPDVPPDQLHAIIKQSRAQSHAAIAQLKAGCPPPLRKVTPGA